MEKVPQLKSEKSNCRTANRVRFKSIALIERRQMKFFKEVVFKDLTQQRYNIHLGVHPFRMGKGLVMMDEKGDYGLHYEEESKQLAQWEKDLADQLWDNIPGMDVLFFDNGKVVIQHKGIYEDDQIIPVVEQIIRPVLEWGLALAQQDGEGK